MKKVITVAAAGTGKMQARGLTIGVDLGDRTSCYCVLNEQGEIVQEQKVATTPKAMRERFADMPRCRMALETGTHSPWVSQLLKERSPRREGWCAGYANRNASCTRSDRLP